MATVESIQEKIITFLSTSGQEAVLFETIKAKLTPDGAKLSALALRGLIERGKVNLRKGGDDGTYVSLVNNLTENLAAVLDAVRSSGSNGIDVNQLIPKIRVPRMEVQKALNTLVSQGLIKEHRPFTNRARRVYLLFDLAPSSQVTGGTFYCSEELDVAYVDELRRRIVVFVSLRHSASMGQLIRFIEEETAATGGGSAATEAGNPASPVTLIHSSSQSQGGGNMGVGPRGFPSAPPPPAAPISGKRVSSRDVQVLVQSLVLDGVLAEVQLDGTAASTPGVVVGAAQYQLASGANVMRHFTCQRKRHRDGNSDGGVSHRHPSLGGGIGSGNDLLRGLEATGMAVDVSVLQRHAELLKMVQDEGLYEPAPISESSADSSGGWSYLPASGFPCLGCPQLLACGIGDTGLINTKQCAYMKEWLGSQ